MSTATMATLAMLAFLCWVTCNQAQEVRGLREDVWKLRHDHHKASQDLSHLRNVWR